MIICFPTEKPQGLASMVLDLFGSAPGFVIVDTEAKSVEEIRNSDLCHVHGMCEPSKALGGRAVDAVVAGGIGSEALTRLRAQGVKVYRAVHGTVGQNIVLILGRKLAEFDAQSSCECRNGGGCRR
ncbi:MAG TPA: NifB/NifX family molybdenum-iron cluster-binding protein [Syntrophobacter fumaroxidans]|nr:NifB/NifX family molybdenum-iron cluster-binding protein [Syntrophobacter fumaroxidans]